MAGTGASGQDVKIEAEAVIASVSAVAPGILTRSYLSDWFFYSASEFAKDVAQLEASLQGPAGAIPRHVSLVTSSLLHSVAYMEARANEVFEDARDTLHEGRSAPLGAAIRQKLAEWWTAMGNGMKSDILLNFQMLLMLNNKEPLDKGAQPYQDAALLIRLRNALVHFRPSWQRPEQAKGLEIALGNKFPANASIGKMAWWPYGCLGAGCAQWGVDTADALVARVMTAIGLPPHTTRLIPY